MAILYMDTYTELQNKLKALRARKMTWQEIGDLIGISKALAWNVAHGKSDSVQARHYFGLPPKLVEIAPCAICGEVHLQKTCAARRNTRPRYRLALEFASESERDECARLMALYLAPDRAEQSRHILDILRRFGEFGKLP